MKIHYISPYSMSTPPNIGGAINEALLLMQREAWIPVPGADGRYEFSTHGRLKRLPRIIEHFGIHNNIHAKEKIAKYPATPKKGYRRYRMTFDGGKTVALCVHKLLGICFIPNDDPERKTQVNHKDGDMNNDALYNLEWCTPGENQKHAWDTGLRKRAKDGDHPNCKRVINTVTGEIHPSIKGLSVKIGVKFSTLKCQLNGTYQNKTIYRIL